MPVLQRAEQGQEDSMVRTHGGSLNLNTTGERDLGHISADLKLGHTRQSREHVPRVAVLALAFLLGLGCAVITSGYFAAEADAATQGEAIVAAAASMAGKPYCWAGGNERGPTHGEGNREGATQCPGSTAGFDCTGLTQYAAYQGTGGAVDLTHHNSEQAKFAPGQWITSEAALQPGDIVYFGYSRGDVTHAAIYAGVVNGQQMIWDANTAFWIYPDGVHERTLDSENSLGFVGAARVWSGNGPPPPPPPPPIDNGGSLIKGVASGRCLDGIGGGTDNGTGLQLWDCNGDPQQHWVYAQGQLKLYGNYDRCLDADSNSGGANGTRIQIWECNSGQNQQWIAEADGSLRSVASGRCLDAVGGGSANGTTLQLWDCSGAPWQKWIGPPSPNGGSPVRSLGTGLCLDVPGASISPGTRVQMWDCNSGAQQQWIHDGTELRVYANDCLDAVNGGTANGTPIQIWPCNGGAQQQWTWGPDGTIRSIPSGRCLDVVGDGLGDGTTLQLWDCSGVDWQHWVVAPPANGGGLIQGVASGRCLDVTGGSTSPGARVQMYDCNGNAQQQWILDGTELRVYADECLDAVGGGTSNGTPIQVWPCNGGPQQQWTWTADGTIRSIPSGRCLDVVDGDTANGAPLQLWDCSGASWQRFVRPAPPAGSCPAQQIGTSPKCPKSTRHPMCVVPNLKRMDRSHAKRALTRAHCKLGEVRRRKHLARRHLLHVAAQTALPASRHLPGYKVGITLR